MLVWVALDSADCTTVKGLPVSGSFINGPLKKTRSGRKKVGLANFFCDVLYVQVVHYRRQTFSNASM